MGLRLVQPTRSTRDHTSRRHGLTIIGVPALMLIALTACSNNNTQTFREGGEETSAASGKVACEGGERMSMNGSVLERPGGPIDIRVALDEWVSKSLSNVDPAQFVEVKSEASLRSKTFEYVVDGVRLVDVVLEFIGDSWHVTGWHACKTTVYEMFAGHGEKETP